MTLSGEVQVVKRAGYRDPKRRKGNSSAVERVLGGTSGYCSVCLSAIQAMLSGWLLSRRASNYKLRSKISPSTVSGEKMNSLQTYDLISQQVFKGVPGFSAIVFVEFVQYISD